MNLNSLYLVRQSIIFMRLLSKYFAIWLFNYAFCNPKSYLNCWTIKYWKKHIFNFRYCKINNYCSLKDIATIQWFIILDSYHYARSLIKYYRKLTQMCYSIFIVATYVIILFMNVNYSLLILILIKQILESVVFFKSATSTFIKEIKSQVECSK